MEEGTVKIGEKAFWECQTLRDIRFPVGLAEIGNEAFFGCWHILRVHLPNGLKRIGDAAFCGCALMREVWIPEGAASIGAKAFAHCQYLNNIYLPDSLEDISPDAFEWSGTRSRLYFIVKPGSEERIATLLPDSLKFASRFRLITLKEDGGERNSYPLFPSTIERLDAEKSDCD